MQYYVVNAFSAIPFHGNQAGVCVLHSFPEATTMQAIAHENHLSETAFVVPHGNDYNLRWFTPTVEVALCGHATLGTAYVLHRFYDPQARQFAFHTQSGILTVRPIGDQLEMSFPLREQRKIPVTRQMREAVNASIQSAYAGYNLQLELESEEAVQTLMPNMHAIQSLKEYHGVIVTAKGNHVDFVSRFFAPNVGVEEDPVTGSTHTSLVPYWAERLQKNVLVAKQLSSRGGDLYCTLNDQRVLIAGVASLYLKGEISL